MNRLSILVKILSVLLFSSCTTQPQGILIHNVEGYTLLNDELYEFEAIAFSGDEILATGTTDELTDQYGSFEQIDGDGNTLLPGLIDAHVHVMGLGFQELDVDVSGIESLDATLEKIGEFAEANPELEWIRGRGWNQVLWEENEFPTAADLDEVVGDRPVWLTRVDGHAGWANTRALEIANISRDTPDVQGGRIIRDSRGDATGIFIDNTMSYISSNIPERSE